MNINPPSDIQMNNWLAENPGIEIIQMSQSESMVVKEKQIERNLSVTIIYRESETKKIEAPSPLFSPS
jgi:hypothetical protein